MIGSGRHSYQEVRECWEALTVVLEWSRSNHDYPGVVGRPSRKSGTGREALPDVREWLGGPPG